MTLRGYPFYEFFFFKKKWRLGRDAATGRINEKQDPGDDHGGYEEHQTEPVDEANGLRIQTGLVDLQLALNTSVHPLEPSLATDLEQVVQEEVLTDPECTDQDQTKTGEGEEQDHDARVGLMVCVILEDTDDDVQDGGTDVDGTFVEARARAEVGEREDEADGGDDADEAKGEGDAVEDHANHRIDLGPAEQDDAHDQKEGRGAQHAHPTAIEVDEDTQDGRGDDRHDLRRTGLVAGQDGRRAKVTFDKVGADGLKGGPDGRIDELDQQEVPVDQGKLEHASEVKAFARLELLDLFAGQQAGATLQVTDDERIKDADEDRKGADDQREPEGPNPVAGPNRDRIRGQGAQEVGQSRDGDLETDGDGQALGAKPLVQDGLLHGDDQARTDPEQDPAGDHQAKRFNVGRERRHQTAKDHDPIHGEYAPDRAKDIKKDASKDGEERVDDRYRGGNHTILGIVDMKVLSFTEVNISHVG